MKWSELSIPWQICLEETWAAYCAGSTPCGAVVVDGKGAVLGKGRSHEYDLDALPGQIGAHTLAHASLNALLALRNMVVDFNSCALFTALEPCPLCVSALAMSGVRQLFFGARDPVAGSVALLNATPFLARRAVQVTPPQSEELEHILTALHVEHLLRINPQRPQLAIEMTRDALPQAVRFGERLRESVYYEKIQHSRLPASLVFDQLRIQYKNFLLH